MKNNKTVSLLMMLCILIVIIIADLLSKFYAVGVDQEFIPGFIKFLYSENTGAAWSIFSGSQVGLLIVSIILVALIIVYGVFSQPQGKLFYVSLAFILGGALGNMFDRFIFGYVRDFIKLEFMDFPIFNLADAALTVGVILLLIYYIISAVKEGKRKANGK